MDESNRPDLGEHLTTASRANCRPWCGHNYQERGMPVLMMAPSGAVPPYPSYFCWSAGPAPAQVWCTQPCMELRLAPMALPLPAPDCEADPFEGPDCMPGGPHQPHCRHAGKPVTPATADPLRCTGCQDVIQPDASQRELVSYQRHVPVVQRRLDGHPYISTGVIVEAGIFCRRSCLAYWLETKFQAEVDNAG